MTHAEWAMLSLARSNQALFPVKLIVVAVAKPPSVKGMLYPAPMKQIKFWKLWVSNWHFPKGKGSKLIEYGSKIYDGYTIHMSLINTLSLMIASTNINTTKDFCYGSWLSYIIQSLHGLGMFGAPWLMDTPTGGCEVQNTLVFYPIDILVSLRMFHDVSCQLQNNSKQNHYTVHGTDRTNGMRKKCHFGRSPNDNATLPARRPWSTAPNTTMPFLTAGHQRKSPRFHRMLYMKVAWVAWASKLMRAWSMANLGIDLLDSYDTETVNLV